MNQSRRMLTEGGMTLLDTMMSTVVLGVGLLGIAGLLIYTMNGDVSAKQTTSAVTLAQVRIERAVSVGFVSSPTPADSDLCIDTTGIEDYGTIKVPFSLAGNCTTLDPNAEAFRRETVVSQPGNPNPGNLNIVTVTVRWFDIAHNPHSFQTSTLVAQVAS